MDRAGKSVGAIVLAAGRSARMGRPKQLLPFSGNILAWQVVNEALKAGLSRVVLVLGYKADEIRAALKSRMRSYPRLETIVNEDFDRGMSTSIIAGLSAIETTHDYMMILLADMPFIRREVIDLLLARYLVSDKPIGAIKLKKGFGHPVVFHRRVFPELRRLQGDRGARSIIEKYGPKVCLVEPPKAYDPFDIDTREDFAKAEKMTDPLNRTSDDHRIRK